MPALNEIKILIVDDSITVRKMLHHQLEDMGIEIIEEAKNGAEALEIYKDFKPHLVFMDINMPEMNGVEGLSRILKHDPDASIIMLSSLGTKEKINETLEIGAKNFLMKPVENENLERIINSVINQ